MADTATYETNSEPATKHDVTEGGVLGAVGGAVVGGLAGGPVGAIIGAVVGGAASAGAVGVVDKHDHDYNGTEYRNSVDDVDDDVVANDLSASRSAEYADTAATREDTSYSAPVTTSTSYNDATAVRDNGDNVVIPVVEEELMVGKRVEQTGGARIHTEVTETPVDESVNLREEHVTIDRRPVDRAATDADFNTGARDINITETREVPVVAKEARVVEEVVIGKTATDRTETIHDTVRRTDVSVDEIEDATTTTGTRSGTAY